MVKLESRRELASNSLSPRKTSAARKSAEPSNQLGAGHYVRSHDIDVSERRDKDICKRIIANNYTVHAIKKISNLQLSVESALHCFGFFFTSLDVIGHFLGKLYLRLKLIGIWPPAFSRASDGVKFLAVIGSL